MDAPKGFVTRLHLEEYLKDGESVPGEWVLFSVLSYITGTGRRFDVPRGFITDLASIPQLARSFLDVNDKHRRPAVLHDFLYSVQPVTRQRADNLLLEAMEVVGVPRAKRLVIWAAVRAGGWVRWNKAAKAAIPGTGDFVPAEYFNDDVG